MLHLKLFTCTAGYHAANPPLIRASICHISHHCRALHRLQATTKYCSALRLNSFRHTEDCLHTTAGLNADKKEPGMVNVMWGKFATKVRMFTAGVKALYGDMKLASELRAKYGKLVISKKAPNVIDGVQTDVLYSRNELQFVHRTLHDVKQMLPTVILFFIPFVGYIAPFLAFAYPEKLLSQHFWTPSLRADMEASAREAQRASFMALMAKLNKDLDFIPTMIAQFAGEEEQETSTNPESALYELSKLPVDYLAHLYTSWGVKPLIPTQRSQQQLLQRHLEYVFVCDWLVHLEGGVVKLSHPELVSACMERGLHFDLKVGEEESAKEMRRKLDSWIKVSIRHKECPSLLLAHLPIAQY